MRALRARLPRSLPSVRAARASAPALLLALACACAGWRASQLYVDGTEALDRGDAGAAVALLERAAALEPDASEIRNHLGLAYRAAGRRGEAERAFEAALRLDCDNEAARHNLVSLVEGRPAPAAGAGAREEP